MHHFFIVTVVPLPGSDTTSVELTDQEVGQLLIDSGRGERIRTFDLLNPIQVRYQAALRPD